jgi:hypothetical protein
MRWGIAVATLGAAVALSACNVDKPLPPPSGTGSVALTTSVPLSVAACEPHTWCIAAGTNPTASEPTGAIEYSVGGHGRWGRVAVPPLPGVTLSSAACWTSGCLLGGYGTGGAVDLIVNPKGRASARAGAIPGTDVTALACPAPGRCLALATAATETIVARTTNSGAAWSELSVLPKAITIGAALACSSTSDCVALGAGLHGATAAYTTDGGVHWALAARPGGLEVFTSVACATTTWCLATAHTSRGASALLQTMNGGASWAQRLSALHDPDAVACYSATGCLVGGGTSSGGELVALGATGSPRGLSLSFVPEPILALACASATKCVGVTQGSTASIVP